MSEDTTTNEENNQDTDVADNNDAPKFAGKFNDVESLEKGYKDLEKHLGARSGVQQEYDALKKSIEVPETYGVIEGIDIEADELVNLQDNAKQLGLNQSQYEKFIADHIDKVSANKNIKAESLNKKVSQYGEQGYTQLAEYIKNEHGLSEETISHLSDDELSHFSQKRKSFLESSIDTGSHYGGSVSQEDVRSAYHQFNQLPPGKAKNEAYNKWVKLSEIANG